MTDQLVRTQWKRDATLAPDLRPVLNATIGAVDVFVIVITAVAAKDADGLMWWLLLATCTAAIAFLIMFVGLLIGQSLLGIREWTTETPVIPETGRAMRVMAVDLDNPRNFTVAKWALSEGQMMRLANALNRAGWKLLRNNVRDARVLPAADIEAWRDVVIPEFVRAQLADENGNITERGKALFAPYLSPAPAQFQATFNPPPVRRQSDGAAREGRQGGAGGVRER